MRFAFVVTAGTLESAHVSEGRATVAIVRHHINRDFATEWFAMFAVIFVASIVFARFPNGRLTTPENLVVLFAVLEGYRWKRFRRVAFFAMPLFGRQLARAHVIAPLVLAFAAVASSAAGYAVAGAPLSIAMLASMVFGAVVATIIAISAAFREGPQTWPFLVGAWVAGTVVSTAWTLVPHDLAWRAALALVLGFFALRAFGETLARYDPI